MEIMSGIHDPEKWKEELPNYLKKDDPLSPYDMDFIPEGSRRYCYVYLTPHLFEVAGQKPGTHDPKYYGSAMSFCNRLLENDLNRRVCLGAFGKEYVVLANSKNVQSIEDMSDDKLKLIIDWCNLGPKEGTAPCLEYALQSLYWGGENNVGVSIRFCNIISDKVQKNNCNKGLIAMVGYYYKNNNKYKESFCEKILEDYKIYCESRLLKK